MNKRLKTGTKHARGNIACCPLLKRKTSKKKKKKAVSQITKKLSDFFKKLVDKVAY